MDPARDGSFDDIADAYDESRGGLRRADSFAGMLAPLLDPAAPVVDIGTGTGLVARCLVDRGYTVYGYDVAPAMVELARARLGRSRAWLADAADLPLPDASVQQAVSTWLLHVVASRAAVLRELRRILAPGGRYLVVPAAGQRPDDEIGRIVNRLERELDPEGHRDDGIDRLAPLAAELGFAFRAPLQVSRNAFEQSPVAAAEAIEAGLFSAGWNPRDAAAAQRSLQRAVAELRALPDAGLPRTRVVADYVMEFTRSG